MNVLEVIKTHGLSIRQIPLVKIAEFHIRHFKEGDEKIDNNYCRRRTVPKYAGYWLCKKVTDTYEAVIWHAATDNLAPTLEESVALFLKNEV